MERHLFSTVMSCWPAKREYGSVTEDSLPITTTVGLPDSLSPMGHIFADTFTGNAIVMEEFVPNGQTLLCVEPSICLLYTRGNCQARICNLNEQESCIPAGAVATQLDLLRQNCEAQNAGGEFNGLDGVSYTLRENPDFVPDTTRISTESIENGTELTSALTKRQGSEQVIS